MDDLTGQCLNDYQLLRRLGRGAMAAVYLAEQRSLARRVAVKVLSAELSRDPAAVERFQHEARAAASLVHPGIVQVYEVGAAELDGVSRHFLSQEYVAAGTLGRLVARDGALTPGRVLRVLEEVGAALDAAATRGVVHRDIKPDNLMVDPAGAIKVADFGLARLAESDAPRLTQAGVALGTPLYMSPEQIEGRAVDSRSDLYSLGVTAYQLLVGEAPFTGDTPLSVAVQHLNNPPPRVSERRPDVPEGLARVIDRLLEKSPADRYESPEALLDALAPVRDAGQREGWAAPVGTGSLTRSVTQQAATSRAAPPSADEAEAIARLAAASRRNSDQPSGRRARGSLWRAATAVVLGLVVGGATVRAFRGEAFAGPTGIERLPTVKEQLYHAKLIDTPAAWDAVLRLHPEADGYFHTLALRGAAIAQLRDDSPSQALQTLTRFDRGRGVAAPTDVAAEAVRLAAAASLGREATVREARAAIEATGRDGEAALARLPEWLREACQRAQAALR